MYPLVKSLHPKRSWLSARALNWCDMTPISESCLSHLIRMNLGIQCKISGSVLLSCAIHFVSSSTVSVSNFVWSLSGQSMWCIAVSLTAAVRTSFVWAWVAGEAANLDPRATVSRILLRPPNLVHVGLILERQVQVLKSTAFNLLLDYKTTYPSCAFPGADARPLCWRGIW